MLLLIELLQVRHRVTIARVEANDFRERFERAIDKSAVLVVEPETQQHVRMFELSQVRPLEQRLVLLDRAANLSLFPIQIAENEMNLEWIAGSVGRLTEILDRRI